MNRETAIIDALEALLDFPNQTDKVTQAIDVLIEESELYWCDEQDRLKSIHNEGP